MEQDFQKWLIKNHEKMDPKYRPSFLRTLKFQPDKALNIIASNLNEWGLNFCYQTNSILHIFPDQDSRECLRAFQEHFAKELASVSDKPETTGAQRASSKGSASTK